jgi:hypothetical protein
MTRLSTNIFSQSKDDTLVFVRIFLITLTLFIIASTAFVLLKMPFGEDGSDNDGRTIGEIPSISIQGEGSIFVKPDVAIVEAGVEVDRVTVSAATARNTEITNAILAFLKESGIEKRDLRTTQYNVFPRYETDRDGQRTLKGYTVSQSVRIKIRNFDAIGAILEGVTSRGANQVGSLMFTVDDEENIRKEARDLAISDAKEKARELAGKLGVGLDQVLNFNEGYFFPSYAKAFGGDFGGEGVAAVPVIEPGENEIKVSVTITYEIK